MAGKSTEEKRIAKIVSGLKKHYPKADCHLNHKNALELLIATILAAQCTDARVNEVTPGLFKKYPDAKAFAKAKQEDLEEEIRSTGFFRNKAKSIKNCCTNLVEEYDGNVPDEMDLLTKLPGVGRKTANVVLGTVFDQPAIIVDTHVIRVSGRLGLTSEEDPEKIEKDLQGKIPKNGWTDFSHQLGDHGRTICEARRPKCGECFLADVCVYYKENVKG